MEAEALTVRVGTTPTGLTAPPQPPRFFTGRMPFLPPNQQCQSTEGIESADLFQNLVHASISQYGCLLISRILF